MDHDRSTRATSSAQPVQGAARRRDLAHPAHARGEHPARAAATTCAGCTPSPTSSRSRCAGRPEPPTGRRSEGTLVACGRGQRDTMPRDPAHHDVRRATARRSSSATASSARAGTGPDRQGARRDHQCCLLDLPHHGRSPWPRSSTTSRWPTRSPALCRDEPVTLVGHSMGGKVAMVAARLRHPERGRAAVRGRRRSGGLRHGRASSAATSRPMRGLDLDALERRAGERRARRGRAQPRPCAASCCRTCGGEGDGWRWQPNLEVLGEELAEVTGWPAEALADAAPYDGPVLWVAGGDSGYITEAGTRRDGPVRSRPTGG